MSGSRTAAPGAKGQVARLLTLVPFLHSRGEVRIDDAAEALGVSPAQVVADLKVLLMCGLPGGYPDDLIDVDLDALEGPEADGVIRVSNADYLGRPLRLTPTETTAIIVALRALRESAEQETREIVDRALSKLELAAADGAAAAHIEPGAPVGGPELVRLERELRDATARRRQIRLRYYVPSRDEQSERIVDPRGVVEHDGLSYLDAWCHSAEAPRLFRLDRIETAEILDTEVSSEPGPPRDLDREGMFPRSPDSVVATLLLDPPAHWVAEYYPTEKVRRRKGGCLEVELVVANRRWLERLLLRLAPHARVVDDATAEAVLAQARRTLELYS